MDRLDIHILEEPQPLIPGLWRHEVRKPAWRWRYRDPDSGDLVDPSEPLTPAEVFELDPAAELIPGSRTMVPEPAIQIWR